MPNDNAFMASAKKSKRKQAVIQHAQPEVEELVVITVRIPATMREKMRFHYARTGENQTQLVNRLLEDELCEDDFY